MLYTKKAWIVTSQAKMFPSIRFKRRGAIRLGPSRQYLPCTDGSISRYAKRICKVLASTGSDSLWEVHQAIGTRSRQRKISLPTRHNENSGICMWLKMKFWPDIIVHCS